MKQKNFVKRSLKFAAWMMAHISWLTMAFSPVALAKQAENINTQSLKLAIQDLKLNQKITVKEFWDKTKADYPGYAYYEMEEFVKQNPNALMPKFEVRSVKGSDGLDVPVLTFVENGKTHTIQVFGDEKNYIKFDGVSMTEAESTQPEKIFQKLIDNNPKIKKEYNDAISKEAAVEARQYRTEMKTQAAVAKANKGRFSSFNGFTRITPQMWAAMSLKDRAQYLVLMREMWTDARRVNFYSNRAPASQPVKQPVKKTAPKKTSSLEKMYQLMIGENAEAETGSSFIDWTKEKCEAKGAGWVFVPANSAGNAFADCIYQPGGTKPQTPPVERKKTETPAKSSASKKDIECINAGWITQNNSKECSYDFIRKGISNRYEKAFMTEVVQECGTNQVSCNPLIFGYQNNGKIKCIGTGGSRTGAVTDNPQKATWFGGPCDVVNPLNTSDSGALADSQLRSGRNYNQNRAAQLAAIEKDQAKDNFKLTEQYLDSVLKRQGKGSLSEILKQPWSAEVDDLLVQNQKIFEDEINRAIEICERDAADLRQKDTNQMGACDQLHRRWLFTEQFVSKYRSAACPDETDYIYDLNVLDGEKKAPTLKTADNRTQNQNKNNIVHNKTKVADLKADTDKDGKKLLCSCVDSSGKTHKFPLGSNKGSDESAKVTCAGGGKEEPPVTADACKSVVEADKSLAGAVIAQGDKCLCKDTNTEVKSELGEHSEVRYYCGQTTPVAKKCEQYDEAFRSQLDDDCLCKNKKGDDTKRKPKTVNTGFKAIFTSSKNNSDQQADGKRYTCNQGPNWWVIGGIAAGTAGLLALLLHHKKKCPPGTTGKYPNCIRPQTPVCPAGTYGTPPNCAPNTCPAGQVGTPPNCTTPTCGSNQTGTYPNCVTCEPPKVIVSGVCQCAPCGQISVCGQMVDQTQNPVTCQCTPVPSEGGCGTNPDDDGGWGGTAQ